MGNCVSTQDRDAQMRSQEIDRQIEEDSRKLKKECKILLQCFQPVRHQGYQLGPLIALVSEPHLQILQQVILACLQGHQPHLKVTACRAYIKELLTIWLTKNGFEVLHTVN